MRFESPWFFLLLVLVPILFKRWRASARPASVKFSLPIPALLMRRNPLLYGLSLKIAVFVLMVIALARPQASFRQTERTVSGVDIIVVIDFSASMNIEDLGEHSRMDLAKDTVEGFVRGRQNDRIGMVIFSGEALTLAPPTLDYGLVLKALKDASIGVLKDGTAIGDGLATAVGHLRNSTAKSRVIILLTDGDNNVGQVDPATAGELAAGYGIRVYSIAIGKEGRVRLPIKHKGVFGNTITTYQYFDNALNPELLQQISARTNAKFYRVTEEDALERVFKEIDQLERSEIKAHEKVRYEERYPLPLTWAAFLAVVERVLGLWVWRVLP